MKKSNIHIKKHLVSYLFLLVFLLCCGAIKAQTDFSGTYYIGSLGSNTDASNKYYLCPTENWYFYQATNNYTTTDNGMPFLTTYKCKDHDNYDASKAIWTLVKHPTENDCYYIIQKKTGRYVVSNGQIIGSNNANRMRVHLETVANASALSALGNLALFEITYHTDHYVIVPHSTSGQNGNNKYLIVNNGNYDQLDAEGSKADGPNGTYGRGTGGIIGLYVLENNVEFYLEDLRPEAPVITNNYDGTVTITAPAGTTVYYTTNGTTPTPSTPTSLTPPDNITLTDDIEVFKAITVKTLYGDNYSSTVTEYNLPICSEPVISFADGNVSISCATPGFSIFYTTDGNTPTTSSTAYSTPFSISNPTTVKAIATSAGYIASDATELTINKVATPTIQNNGNNAISITCATDGVTIYYTTDGSTPTTSSEEYTAPLTDDVSSKTINAIAVKTGMINSAVGTGSVMLKCATPVINRNGEGFSITCATTNATIYYTDDGTTTPTTSSTLYSGPRVNHSLPVTIKAFAIATGYYNSDVATANILEDLGGSGTPADPYLITKQDEVDVFVEKANTIDGASAYYKVTATQPLNFSNATAITQAFSGTLDGNMQTFTGLTHPLFNTINGGKVKNLFLDNVAINSGTNIGAVCGEATGDSRIYNCGVLASGSTVNKDADGYDELSSCSSTLSGSGYVGGIAGLLGGTSRVINCFSYANITGGSYVGGIVGYNNVAYDHSDYKTMVMNCMFYGDITGGSSKAPIYNGNIITNDGDANGVNNFNYFRIEADYVKNRQIDVYNCALAAETRFLQRFEFFRYLLNSNRELAAWWATGNVANVDEIKKWVMEPSQIGTTIPYPILKTPGRYPSVVNYTPNATAYDEEHRCEGRKLTSEGDNGILHVTIQMGDGAVYNRPFKDTENAATISTSSIDLTITDKDMAHFNFNYGKVQLPYYNDVGTQNYKDNRVVTGWKIVSIKKGNSEYSGVNNYSTGADVTYDANGNLTATPYNFADRKCTGKDLFSVSGRIFNQGAYWDVPDSVTAITIEPYWGKAVYLSDAYWDVTYKNSGTDAMATAANVTNVGGGQRYNGVSTFNDQPVITSIGDAISSSKENGLFKNVSESANHTVYDYVVVLVGNYHHTTTPEATNGKPYTVTSVDLDGDNEPDYSLMLRFNGRTGFHPVRYDFLNLIGLGMAQKTTGGTGSYNLGIMQPKYWFEVTNTALFRVTQFEYSRADRVKKPYILQGGVIEQWVTQQQDAGDRVSYFIVGGNVWFKEFHRGSHQDNANKSTPHPPVSVTGGDYNQFYLTGLYQSQAAIYDDNAECYINGGRFGEMAGAGMEGIGTTDGKGNITWIIDNADIREFYGGGINYDKPVHGNIHTIISNSYVNIFCGGPKFGDMESGRTVKTIATGCTFGTYFGAGYGGNAYNRYAPSNRNNVINLPGRGKVNNNEQDLNSWNDWVLAEYTQTYNSTYSGISTRIDYQFIPMSSNVDNVARLWVEFVGFSLAQCNDVTSTLTNCTINENFYGGGSLGKVAGDATSTLDGCTVNGNVYGAGFSASLPTVEVDSIGFRMEPYYYTDLGTYRIAEKGHTTTYNWVNRDTPGVDNDEHILYTDKDLTTLGKVMGNVNLTITGNSTIYGDVYGGGALSDANTDANNSTNVNILDGTYNGNIYGGGEGSATVAAKVNGVVTVNIGAIDGGGAISGNATLTSSSVFGCNNTNGSPQADVFVNIYKTAQQNGVNTVNDAGYAIDKVFGGGNEAGYDPLGTGTYKTTVHIFTCDNTISQVYGGGNAADAEEVTTIIDGGRFDWVYGGGNGVSRAANIIGDMTLLVDGGTFNHLLNGSNTQGTIGGSINATITNESGCGTGEDFVQEYFCGNNEAPIGSIETPGSITTNILCNPLKAPAHIANLYGGSNRAIIYGDVTLNINGGLIDNVFGGSKGVVGSGADITGNVTLNLYGGTIGNAFGGCDVEGNIDGIITVNVFENSDCPLSIDNVYGGGRDASYTPTTAKVGAAKEVPRVNILKGTVNNDVYGGGLGTGATVAGNPQVVTGRKVESVEYRCIIGGNVFGGGSKAQVSGDTRVVILNKSIIKGNVYGGGNEAEITGDTQVIVNASSPE